MYAHRDVRATLERVHSGKCAYCESRIEHAAYTDIEHYRPKGRVRQGTGSPATEPGYWWLAYEWDNLLLACPRCNRTAKGDRFPLADPAGRALGPDAHIDAEAPLLLDPAREDPDPHLEWRDEVVVGRTDRGAATVAVLQLNRVGLLERRRERLTQLTLCRDLVEHPDPEIATRVRKALELLAAPDAEYLAMARAL